MAGRPLRGHHLGVAAFAAGAALVPLVLPNEYYVTVLIVAGFHTILTLGLNLLMGYAGQVSLGHAAFYGIAAYATGVLTARFHWPVPAAIHHSTRCGPGSGSNHSLRRFITLVCAVL